MSIPSQTGTIRLCRIATVPVHITMLLRSQIRYIIEAGIDLTVVSSPGIELEEIAHSLLVRCCTVPMVRRPHPIRDLLALFRLVRFLKRERFDIVHSSTPKAGLLAAIAGVIVQVPVRIHTYTGQPWSELHGPTRWVARESDRLIALLNTHVYADSISQRDFLVGEGLVDSNKISVLGAGSISGVDLQKFDPIAGNIKRTVMRKKLGISESSVVVIFVGRVTKDKGIVELVSAFHLLCERVDDIHLLLVGQLEPERDPLPPRILAEISLNPKIHSTGFVSDPESYLAIADIFCLPSYREGFGSVVIEAGAMNLPTVATGIIGLVDAVVGGETGLLVPPKDIPALTEALLQLVQSPDMRHRMGKAAHRRTIELFDATQVNKMVVDEYFRLLRKA